MATFLSSSLNIPDTGQPRVVIIGGGFGGIHTVKQLKGKGFQVVLIDRQNFHTFQPLLYQVATAGLHPEAIVAPFRALFRGHDDFHFRLCTILSIDPDGKVVHTALGDIAYEYLIIGAGSRPNYFGNDDIGANVLPLKTIPDALYVRNHIMKVLEKADMATDVTERRKLLSIVLVGGGATGVEMAGALAELRKHVVRKDYPGLDISEMTIYLVQGGERLLPTMSKKASRRAKKDLEQMGVTILLDTIVQSYDGVTLRFAGKDPIESSTVVWTAGVRSVSFEGLRPEWLENGRIVTDQYCRVPGDQSIFAIGDIALMKNEKYPLGHPGVTQVAIQTGTYVGKHLPSFHRGGKVTVFRYFDKGDLATIGRRRAVLDLPRNLFIGGLLAWYVWLFIHITYLDSFRNKLLVFASWMWNYFTYDKGNRLIISAPPDNS